VSLILNIETATAVCSVALSQNGNLLALVEEKKANAHAENITLFVEKVFEKSGKKISDIDAVAVSAGPGSYTGLRIGMSTAKGLCFALDKPLIAISTLKSMANGVVKKFPAQEGVLLPLLDARRMEVYCAAYDLQLNELIAPCAKIMDEFAFKELLVKSPVYFFGDGSEKCKSLYSKNKDAIFIDDFFPSAISMVELAEEKFARKDFENSALIEPFYLKEFYGVKSGNVK
jgi:tRNA threonylcarbamoyladenosine biosynthesis protein TsaB